MTDNRQFREMHMAAIKKLEGRSPEDISRKGNLYYDNENNVFCFETFGKKCHVSYPEFAFDQEPEMWTLLTILQYMDEADGTPLTNCYIGLNEFQDGGLVRGSSFDRENEKIIQKKIGQADPESVKQAMLSLGGKILDGKGDLTALFYFMPNFPLLLNIWFEDDEFPASCKVLCDQAAEHYLKVEAAGLIAGVLLQEIETRL